MTMLAIKEPDHVVRMPFRRLCKKAHMEPEVCREALRVLLEPDQRSIDDQPFDGRRIEEVEGGWLILNGEKYRQEMSKLMLRLRKTEWQREDRAKKRIEKQAMKSGPLVGESAYVAAEKAGATPEELERMIERRLPDAGPALTPVQAAMLAKAKADGDVATVKTLERLGAGG